MPTRLVRITIAFFIVSSIFLNTQATKSAGKAAGTSEAKEKDVDLLSLKVLKAATDPIRAAKSLSFTVLVSRDQVATNGQIHPRHVVRERSDEDEHEPRSQPEGPSSQRSDGGGRITLVLVTVIEFSNLETNDLRQNPWEEYG